MRVGTILWGGLALLDLGHVAAAPSYAELGALTVLVVVASVGTRPASGVGAALTGWLLVDGFVEHRYGALGFDAGPDVAMLVVLVGLSLVATRAHR